MLKAREASMPEMWASTPGWFITIAEITCFIADESFRRTGTFIRIRTLTQNGLSQFREEPLAANLAQGPAETGDNGEPDMLSRGREQHKQSVFREKTESTACIRITIH